MNKTIYIKAIYLGIFCSLTFTGMAQHKPQYTQYMQNNFLLNPALAGIERYTDIKLGYRNQWRNLPGAPKTYYFTGHTPLYSKRNKNRRPMPRRLNNPYEISNERLNNVYNLENLTNHHGLGLMVTSDQLGSFSRISGELSYAYHQRLFRSMYASIGFSAGYILGRLDPSKIDVVDQQDFSLFNNLNNQNFDVTAGMLIYNNDFYLGFSVCQLYKEETRFLPTQTDNSMLNNYNYFATGAFRLHSSEKVDLIPAAVVKYLDSSPIGYDVSLKAIYDSRFWGGIAYRNSGSYSVLVGISILPYLEFSYSFDYGFGNLDYYSRGSSEFIIGFKMGSKQKVHCPIYF